ncbi:hypothetical protein ACN28S_25865 [Cystobacter fuscus]
MAATSVIKGVTGLRLTWSEIQAVVCCGNNITAYACPGDKTQTAWTQAINYALPPGKLVVGVKAKVHGATVFETGTKKVYVKLNGRALGNYDTVGRARCDGNNYRCDGTVTNNDASTAIREVSLSDDTNQVGIGWLPASGDNKLTFEPEGTKYCLAYVDLELTVAERHIQASVTKLEFGNQLVETESNIKSFEVTNDGDAPLTISNIAASSGFTLVEPVVPGTGIVVKPNNQTGATP